VRRLQIVLAAFPTATAAAMFLITWISPAALGPGMVRDLVALMAMEFVMMHATGIMAGAQLLTESRASRMAVTLLLTGAYAVFAVGIPLTWDAPWLIAAFAVLVGGKVASAWRLPSREKRVVEFVTWGAAFFSYLLFLLLAFAVPFPRLGIDVGKIRIPGGDKLEDPHTIVAAGLVYFLALTGAQIVVHAKSTRPNARPVVVHAESPRETAAAGRS